MEDIDSRQSDQNLAVDESLPNVIGDYRIVQEIGRGGMGIVFEAQHSTMRRRVALKVLPKSSVEKLTYLDRFLTEARSAGKLHHTNIVPVFEIGESEGIHFYSMQFIHGDNLDRVIDDIRSLRNQPSSNGTQRASIRGEIRKREPSQDLSQSIAMDLVRGRIAGVTLQQDSFEPLEYEQTVARTSHSDHIE